MFSIRSTFHRLLAAVSDKLVYHRFMDKPVTFFQDGLRKAILKEVDLIEATLNSLGEKRWLSDGKFNQYGAFVCRDLINKELFDIGDYQHTPLYDKVAHSGLRSNFSPEVQRICNEISLAFKGVSVSYADSSEEQNLFDNLIPLLLFRYFNHEDTYRLYQNYVYAISAFLVFQRNAYSNIKTEECLATKTLIDDFLFEILNNSIHVYSYNFYSVIYRHVPQWMQLRMATPKLKFKHIKEETYFLVMKREFRHIPLFSRRS